MFTAISRLRDVRRDDKGFTLIELLMVIIILGILAAVVVFSVRGIDDTGEEAACKTEYRTVDTAIEAYYAENNAWPGGLADLVTGGFLKAEPTEWVTGIDANHEATGNAC